MDQGATERDDAVKAHKQRTPPYIAYKTFLTLLSELKTNGVPPQIDRSVLRRFAGGLQGQIMLSLRSLDLIDQQNRPNSKLEGLVAAYETDAFKSRMTQIIKSVYPYVFEIDLMTATPTMFSDAFKDALDAKEEVLRKCRTFFLHAAKELEIPVGPRIEKAQFPRPKTNGSKKTKPAKPQPKDVEDPAEDQAGDDVRKIRQPTTQFKELEYQLIDLMAESDIDEKVKQSIWELVQYLMARKAKRVSG